MVIYGIYITWHIGSCSHVTSQFKTLKPHNSFILWQIFIKLSLICFSHCSPLTKTNLTSGWNWPFYNHLQIRVLQQFTANMTISKYQLTWPSSYLAHGILDPAEFVEENCLYSSCLFLFQRFLNPKWSQRFGSYSSHSVIQITSELWLYYAMRYICPSQDSRENLHTYWLSKYRFKILNPYPGRLEGEKKS